MKRNSGHDATSSVRMESATTQEILLIWPQRAHPDTRVRTGRQANNAATMHGTASAAAAASAATATARWYAAVGLSRNVCMQGNAQYSPVSSEHWLIV